MARKKKVESTKVQVNSIKDIQVKFDVNNTKSEVMTDNLLRTFRDMNIDIENIKTRALFTVSRGDKTYRRVLYIAQLRKFLNDDLQRRILAKFFGRALNLTPQFYE